MTVNFSTLNIKTSCDFVIGSVRDSLLNYSIQETPYSLYLTIRKSFARSANLEHCLSNLGPQNFTEIETLKMKLKTAEEANLMLSKNYEEAVHNCEVCNAKIKDLETTVDELKTEAQNVKLEKCNLDKVKGEFQKKEKLIEDFKVEKNKLESDLEFAEKKWKELNKLVKMKDKELHEVKKETARVTENLTKVETEFKNLTAVRNKEKKNEDKKLKKLEKKELIERFKTKPEEFEC